MRLHQGTYFLRQAIQNIRKNRLVHIIGIGTMVVSLLIFGTFLLLFYNIDHWIHGWGNSFSMSVYLSDGIDSAARQKIVNFIRSLPGAKIEQIISKEQALGDLKRALGKEAAVLAGLPRNPLPASIEVVFKPLNGKSPNADQIGKKIGSLSGVAEVQYSHEWLKRFEGLMGMFRMVGLIIGGLLCLGVLFIVTNTIKLTIYSRQEEIEIMKLVGATDWFVKLPFLIEGCVQGAVSGMVALSALYLGYALLSVKKTDILGMAVLHFTFIPVQYAFTILVVSMGLGLLGSFIALGRFFHL